MKLFKKLLNNTLIFVMGVVAIILTLSFLGQALALGMFAFVISLVVGAIGYLLIRRPQD
ncbi:MAG: hypothetical protein ACPHZ7_03070 [Vibrio toranzoniae]